MAVVLRNSEGPIPLGDDGEIIWFARGRVAVGVPRNSTGGRPEAVKRIRERYEQVRAPLALAILVKYENDRPNEETRNDIRHSFDQMSQMLACNAITILGSGFFKSFFISVVSKILRFTGDEGGAYEIHTGLESAATWMHAQLDDPQTSVDEVLETLQWADRETDSLMKRAPVAPQTG